MTFFTIAALTFFYFSFEKSFFRVAQLPSASGKTEKIISVLSFACSYSSKSNHWSIEFISSSLYCTFLLLNGNSNF